MKIEIRVPDISLTVILIAALSTGVANASSGNTAKPSTGSEPTPLGVTTGATIDATKAVDSASAATLTSSKSSSVNQSVLDSQIKARLAPHDAADFEELNAELERDSVKP